MRPEDTAESLRAALPAPAEENARHAGHADILREPLDGRTADELNALADGEEWSPED